MAHSVHILTLATLWQVIFVNSLQKKINSVTYIISYRRVFFFLQIIRLEGLSAG